MRLAGAAAPLGGGSAAPCVLQAKEDGPPSVPPGSGPEPRGHLHSSASASARRSSVSLAIWSKLWQALLSPFSAFEAGKR